MSAKDIYDTAPLGSIIRYSNGEPRPPERFTRKVKAWENENGTGRLVECSPGRDGATYRTPVTFTLHVGTYGSGGTIILVVRRVYMVESQLQFEVIERPAAGMVRILTKIGDHEELQHLAEDMPAAELWRARHGYPGARCETVEDPDLVDRAAVGRAAA